MIKKRKYIKSGKPRKSKIGEFETKLETLQANYNMLEKSYQMAWDNVQQLIKKLAEATEDSNTLNMEIAMLRESKSNLVEAISIISRTVRMQKQERLFSSKDLEVATAMSLREDND